jgi:hypothetical protein
VPRGSGAAVRKRGVLSIVGDAPPRRGDLVARQARPRVEVHFPVRLRRCRNRAEGPASSEAANCDISARLVSIVGWDTSIRKRLRAFQAAIYVRPTAALFLDAIISRSPPGPKNGVLCAWRFTDTGECMLMSVCLAARPPRTARARAHSDRAWTEDAYADHRRTRPRLMRRGRAAVA